MKERYWWYMAFIVCVVCLGIIGFLWHKEVTDYIPNPGQMTSESDVENFLMEDSTVGEVNREYIFIPTGLFIQSLEFVNSSDSNITGYIWQKYDYYLPEDLSRGIIFPEQVNSGSTYIRKEYHHKYEDHEVIGWYFDVTLRQTFDYSKYPLDRHRIWIRIWHKDFGRNIILLPDLNSYERVEQGERFGMDYDIVPRGWNIHETYFNYKNVGYDTTFGLKEYEGEEGAALGLPELYFTVVVGRKFTDAFIINLVPLITVTFMLFFILLTVTSDKKKLDILGFNASGAIGTAATLFFIIVLTHIQVRQKFSGNGIVYIEQFYFTIYIVILMLSLNIYFFSANSDKKERGILSYHNDFIPKVLFWPVICFVLMTATFIYFL